jgi:hypothetical protein
LGIAWLYEGDATGGGVNVFREEFRKLGYLEYRDYSMEPRFAYSHRQRLQELATELVQLPVDIIITGSTPAAMAAMQATRMVPIVAIGVADPVASGLVRRFDRPGGNVTGTALALDEVSYKWLEFLKTVAASGEVDAGLAMMRAGLAAIRALGSEEFKTYFLGLLAETLGAAGRLEAALEVVTEGLAAVDASGECFYAAELHRLRGALLLATGHDRGVAIG